MTMIYTLGRYVFNILRKRCEKYLSSSYLDLLFYSPYYTEMVQVLRLKITSPVIAGVFTNQPPPNWSLSNKTNTHYCQYYNVILGQWDFNQTLQRSAHEGIKLHVPIWLLIAGNYTSRSFLAKKTRVKVNLWNSLLSWRLYMIASMGYTIFRLSFILSYSSMSSGMHIK